MSKIFDCVDCGTHVTQWDGTESQTLAFGTKCYECEWIAKQPDPMYRARLRSVLRMGLKVAPAT